MNLGNFRYIKSSFPDMLPLVSHNLSPMAEISKYIKENDPNTKVVFIGPCTAKKAEAQLEEVKPYVDCKIIETTLKYGLLLFLLLSKYEYPNSSDK